MKKAGAMKAMKKAMKKAVLVEFFFCVVLPSFESNGQGDEEGWRHEGDEEGHEEGSRASCGRREDACHEEGHEEGSRASCGRREEACHEEGHEEGSHEEGSHEEEGLDELSRTPVEGPTAFQSSGVALSVMSGQVGICGTCTFEVCRSSHVDILACEQRVKKK